VTTVLGAAVVLLWVSPGLEAMLKVMGGQVAVTPTVPVWSAVLLSGIIANMPFAAAMLPVVSFLAQTVPGADSQVFFYALPVGTATGGNSSPIGASANLMTFSTLWLFIRS
jgi:Na+/H+ antiporter NhaD/arsenite permease-like protein